MSTQSFRSVKGTATTKWYTNISEGISSQAQSGCTWYNTTDGGKNPYWRQQVVAGVQAGTSFEGYLQELSPINLSASAVYVYDPPTKSNYVTRLKVTSGEYYPQVPNWYADSQPSLTSANNQALASYVQACRRHQTSFQGGIVLGEAAKTIALLVNPISGLRRGLGAYLGALKKRAPKRSNLSRSALRRERRKILADTWLEYQYGWRPLLSDIEDGMRTLTRYLPEDRKRVQGFGVSEVASHGGATCGTGSDPFIYAHTKTVKKYTVRYYGAMTIDNNSRRRGSARSLGFAPTNWLPTAWELLPWSFLVDYFSNVGDIVSAASLARNSLRWTMKTVITEMETTSTGTYAIYAPGTVGSGGTFGSGFRAYTKQVSRAPYTGSLIPTLELQIPNSVSKWLNIAALSVSSRRLTPYY